MKIFYVSIDWATISGNPATTCRIIEATDYEAAMVELAHFVRKKKNFQNINGGDAVEVDGRTADTTIKN